MGSIQQYRRMFTRNIFLLTFISLSASKFSPIYVKDGNFIDQDQRVRMFRGINSVIKHFPWYDPKMLNPERQKQMGDWGFNAIRLGAMWSGVEPSEGQINETYIGILKEIVAGLEQWHVHILGHASRCAYQ